MNNKTRILFGLSLLSVMILILPPAGSCHEVKGNGLTSGRSEVKPLSAILDDFKETYHVFFSYDESIVKGLILDFEVKKAEAFEVAIKRLMREANLGYEIISRKYCVIYSHDRDGLRKKNKLERKLKQIEKLENSGHLSVQTSIDLSLDRMQIINQERQEEVISADLNSRKRVFSGEIRGKITDAQTGAPLPSATVLIKGTSLGDATNLEGEYRITGVPAGTHTLFYSYIGFSTDSLVVQVEDGQILVQDMTLSAFAIQGATVTVSAQREGQSAAINQQVRSNTIINVVSAERIQELPDENAAESVSRLPGVSIRRSGGEGQRVNIRGLSPKFSTVALDGITIPATGQGRQVFNLNVGQGQASSSPSVDDRSVDLSMIASESLSGIEVYKSLTPDQDGDAIGGRVNFITKKAPSGSSYMVNVLGGANTYHNSLKNIKANGIVSDRFLKDKLGVIASAGYSLTDRSSDNDQVNYSWSGQVLLRGLTLIDQLVERERYNGTLVLDLDLGDHEFVFNNMFARTDVNDVNRSLEVVSSTNGGNWSANHSRSNIQLFSSSLGGKHRFNFFDADWKVTYIQTVDENPYSYGYGFNDNNPLSDVQIPRIDPYLTAQYTIFEPANAIGGTPGGGTINIRDDENYIAQLDLKKNYNFGLNVSGFLKMGGKLSAKERLRERTNATLLAGRPFFDAYLQDHPESLVVRNGLASSNFLSESFDPGEFFNGVYPFPIHLDSDLPKTLFDTYRHLRVDNIFSGSGNYSISEKIYAGYLMTEINLGRRVNVLGGVRYEYSDNSYTAFELNNYSEALAGDNIVISGTLRELTTTQNYGQWLPMLNTRINILRNDDDNNGLDLRLAVTRAITRPDFYNLTPFISIRSAGGVIERSEPTLLPTTAWNYDAFLTLFNNKFGLFTIGAFYKELENIDFIYGRDVEREVIEERFGAQYGLSDGFTVVEPLNAPRTTTVQGIEVELQANLAFLPRPLDGLILYGNFSRIGSEAFYPQRVAFFDLETFQTTLFDSTRINGMPGQSRDIANISIGYDKGRFSGRVSWSFQGSALDFIGANELLDGWIDDYARLDASATFKISQNFSILLNATNLKNRFDRTFVGSENLPGAASIFGTGLWLGLRYKGGS